MAKHTNARLAACVLALLASACGGGGGSHGDADADAPETPEDTGEAVADTATDTAADDAGPECATALECDDGDPCTTDTCDTDFDVCVHEPIDEDGDGYVAETAGGEDCGGNDCDDEDHARNPGASHACDGWDHDCDGLVDRDEDGDGHLSAATCPGTGDDCDDADPTVSPDAVPGCEAEDTDCDGHLDCTDPSCETDCPCTLREDACEDALDEDCDLAVDCADEDCATAPCCAGTPCAGLFACCSAGCCNLDLDEACCGDCGTSCPAGEWCCDGECNECCAREDCDDGNTCTLDLCAAGECINDGTVTDGLPCSGGVCCGGLCAECCADADCDDGNPCTTETCESGACTAVGAGTDMLPCPGGICCGGVCEASANCCSDADCGCIGEVGPCYDFVNNQDACEVQTGCAWEDHSCLNLHETRCDEMTGSECDNDYCSNCAMFVPCCGCDTYSSDPLCLPLATETCAAIGTDSFQCNSCGCTWTGTTCTGNPACTTLDPRYPWVCATCPGCLPRQDQGDCTGAHAPCISNTDEATCTLQVTCDWLPSCVAHNCAG